MVLLFPNLQKSPLQNAVWEAQVNFWLPFSPFVDRIFLLSWLLVLVTVHIPMHKATDLCMCEVWWIHCRVCAENGKLCRNIKNIKPGSVWLVTCMGDLSVLDLSIPLCGAWACSGGGLAATPRAPTLAALPNLTPDCWEGREESEEPLAAPRDSRCCRVLVLCRNL